MFDKNYIQKAISELRQIGVEFASGLSSQQLSSIEARIGVLFPPDLKLLLSEGVPIATREGVKFPDWHEDPERVMNDAQSFVDDLLLFDIVEGGYWSDSLFGPRPSGDKTAQKAAISVVHKLPPLMPVFGHRYIASSPSQPGNPVFSYHGPNETIYYGFDLADYLSKEFGIKKPSWVATEPRAIKGWDQLFFAGVGL